MWLPSVTLLALSASNRATETVARLPSVGTRRAVRSGSKFYRQHRSHDGARNRSDHNITRWARSGQHLLKAKKSYNTLLLLCSTESQSFSTKTGIQEETVHSGLRLTDRAFTTSPVETSRSKMFVGRFVPSHPGFPLSA